MSKQKLLSEEERLFIIQNKNLHRLELAKKLGRGESTIRKVLRPFHSEQTQEGFFDTKQYFMNNWTI